MIRLALRCGARAQLEMARRSHRKAAAVLVYHDIGRVTGDPRRQLVPMLAASTFRAQLRHLGKRYDVVPLSELFSRLSAWKPGNRPPVALTFDDDLSGHADHAAPALTEHGMPATFFLTGRTLDGPDPFWWQDLQALADRGPAGMAEVRDRLSDEWPWVRQASDLHHLARTIKGLSPASRDAVASELRELADGLPRDPGLRAEAVGRLAAAGFEIGFHTRRHDRLPPLGDPELAHAMEHGRARLEAIAGGALRSLAYPHGRADLRVADAAAAAGYEIGLTWAGGAAREDAPRLLVDRTDGWASSAEDFEWRLARVVAMA